MADKQEDQPGTATKAPVVDGLVHPDPKQYFKIRRETMLRAININIALALLFLGVNIYFHEELAGSSWLPTVIGWTFFTNSLPIIGYFSNTAIDEFAKRKL